MYFRRFKLIFFRILFPVKWNVSIFEKTKNYI